MQVILLAFRRYKPLTPRQVSVSLMLYAESIVSPHQTTTFIPFQEDVWGPLAPTLINTTKGGQLLLVKPDLLP